MYFFGGPTIIFSEQAVVSHMCIATMKISSGKTIITFVVSYNAISVSTQVNPNEPNVSFSQQKTAL